MNKFFVLDELIINWWLKNNEISLSNISKHLREQSIAIGEFAENFEEVMKRRMSFGEEYQKD